MGEQAGFVMLCLFCIKMTYLPVHPCTVNCAHTTHCTNSAMPKLTELSGVASSWPRPLTAAGKGDLEGGRPKMSVAGGELQDVTSLDWRWVNFCVNQTLWQSPITRHLLHITAAAILSPDFGCPSSWQQRIKGGIISQKMATLIHRYIPELNSYSKQGGWVCLMCRGSILINVYF